jgi:hypothetical protein
MDVRHSRKAIQNRVQYAAGMAGGAAGWLMDRFRDVLLWPTNLVRDLPRRSARLSRSVEGAAIAVRTRRPGNSVRSQARLTPRGALPVYFVDLLGGPELFRFFWHLATRSARLTPDEIAQAAVVLGPQALRYRDVRVAHGGLLRLIFRLNGGRPFATFHTINVPARWADRYDESLLVHELVHVLQHERVGSVYIPQALHAQRHEGYGYGGPEGLRHALEQGKRYASFNREQQAQIAADYYVALKHQRSTSAYEPFIADLRAGRI